MNVTRRHLLILAGLAYTHRPRRDRRPRKNRTPPDTYVNSYR